MGASRRESRHSQREPSYRHSQREPSYRHSHCVVVCVAGLTLFRIRPRDPIFVEVVSITFKGFKFRFRTDSPLLLAVIDADLVLSIKVTNPNILPIEYTSTVMDILYHGDLLGQAKV